MLLKHFQVFFSLSIIAQHSQDSSINYISLHVWEPYYKSILPRLISLGPILLTRLSNFLFIKEDLWRPSHLLWHLESMSMAHCCLDPIYNHISECHVSRWILLLWCLLLRNGEKTAVNLIWGISISVDGHCGSVNGGTAVVCGSHIGCELRGETDREKFHWSLKLERTLKGLFVCN